MEQGNQYAKTMPQPFPKMAKMTSSGLKAALDSIPGGVVLFARDPELTLLFASNGFYRMCGYSRANFSGKTGKEILELLVLKEQLKQTWDNLAEWIRQGGEMWLEFRIRKKDGLALWVRMNIFSSGSKTAHCVFSDITREKLLQHELSLQQERYRIVTEQLNDVFFEYTFEQDTLYASSRWEELFGYQLQGKPLIPSIKTGDYVYEDDKETLMRAIRQGRRGISTNGMEVRVRKAGGGYLWVSLSLTIICDESGNAVKAVGKIEDIDERMREREKLISNARRDPLTGLYNKVAAESGIRACLGASDEGVRHALMVVDVDNFKGVNDNLGHLSGDAVLKEIAVKLRTLFRGTDIIGRFGGDEFVIFLKNAGTDQQILKKANEVCSIFHETYMGEKRNYKISGSIGVSIFPDHGSTFYDLFKSADTALYEAKKRGKDQLVLFTENSDALLLEKGSGALALPHSQGKAVADSILAEIYDLLRDAKDVQNAFQRVLTLVGREFLAGRVYIFEEGPEFKKSFEWHSENWKPLLGEQPSADFSFAMSRFREGGFYYCPDVSAPQEGNDLFRRLRAIGIKALFLYPVFEAEDLKSVIEVEGVLPWPPEERRMLVQVCKIIGNSLLKFRSSEKTQSELLLLRSVAKRAGFWSYVIDPATWRLRFVNPVVLAAAPGARPGRHCYSALRGRDGVCEGCPVSILESASPAEAELYDEKRGTWFHMSAVAADWEGRKSVLVCGADAACGGKEGEPPFGTAGMKEAVSISK